MPVRTADADPEGLRKNTGSDNAQGYLTTHDLGTGPYVLTAADVGSRLRSAFSGSLGQQAVFREVEIPVITDVSAQQLQFNNGQLAAILHDLPSSAVQSYLDNKAYANYSLPAMMSNYLYVNPHKGMLTRPPNRTADGAHQHRELVKQTYFGRGDKAEQIYPTNMMEEQYTKPRMYTARRYSPASRAACPPTKAITVGYDSATRTTS